MASVGTKTNYVTIWVWLVALLAVSLVASHLPGGRTLAIVLPFGTAVVKAALVAWHYMHLRFEPRVIYALAVIPVLFVLGFMVALFPDFVFHR